MSASSTLMTHGGRAWPPPSLAWEGEVTVVPFVPERTSVLNALRQSAGAGAQALIVITFEEAAETIVREALAQGLYDFLFGDAAKSPALAQLEATF